MCTQLEKKNNYSVQDNHNCYFESINKKPIFILKKIEIKKVQNHWLFKHKKVNNWC